MMNIFTLGSGFVAEHLPYTNIKKRLPLANDWIESILSPYEPDVLINCIGKTGHPNVDYCEIHKEETISANVTLPLMLAEYCAINNIHLINIGSGCIYFGESPHANNIHSPEKIKSDPENYKSNEWTWMDSGWKETDFANPQSFYSKTKYSCDLMLGALPYVTTLRIRMPISDRNTPRNLINKLRGYKQVIDIPNSMTFMNDLVRCVDWAVQNRPGGVFHVTNPQPLTATRIMKEYQKYFPNHSFEYITEQQLDAITIAKRSNCILNTDKLKLAGFEMTNSEEALVDCMAKYIKNMEK